MNSVASRIWKIWEVSAQTGHESLELGRALLSGGTPVKRALLQQAQQNKNQVALRLLAADREWTLLKYHGMVEYARRRLWNRSPTLTSSSTDSQLPAAMNVSGGGAKIAFMVTSRMKQELSEELGYTAEQIRLLTPLQASLVLQHKLPPTDYNEKISVYLKKHETEQKVEQARHQQENERAEHIHEPSSQLVTENYPSQSEQVQILPVDGGNVTPHSDTTPDAMPPQVVDVPLPKTDEANSSLRKWYEVVKTGDKDGVMGLYSSETEAQEGIDAFQFISQKKNEDAEFFIRETKR